MGNGHSALDGMDSMGCAERFGIQHPVSHSMVCCHHAPDDDDGARRHCMTFSSCLEGGHETGSPRRASSLSHSMG